jgi:hypothetical protein
MIDGSPMFATVSPSWASRIAPAKPATGKRLVTLTNTGREQIRGEERFGHTVFCPRIDERHGEIQTQNGCGNETCDHSLRFVIDAPNAVSAAGKKDSSGNDDA